MNDAASHDQNIRYAPKNQAAQRESISHLLKKSIYELVDCAGIHGEQLEKAIDQLVAEGAPEGLGITNLRQWEELAGQWEEWVADVNARLCVVLTDDMVTEIRIVPVGERGGA
jgi:hypothetical protein